MKFRMWLFTILGFLCIGWLCLGLTLTGQTTNTVLSTPGTKGTSLTQTQANSARDVGVAVGSGIVISFFGCTGIPLAAICLLLAWRNQAGLATERRHQEMLRSR